MTFSDILLIILSSAGLLHGAVFGIYLLFFRKKKELSNKLLGLILIIMAFRIGKSVFLYFGEDLELVFIYSGLALLLLIGPLLRWYVKQMLIPDFQLGNRSLLELIPFLISFIGGIFVTEVWSIDRKVSIIVFSVLIIAIYIHLLVYIISSNVLFIRIKKGILTPSKSQHRILSWLRWVLLSMLLIWMTYVLNIIEEAIPYIVGPLVYTLVVYSVSYKAFELKVVELDGEAFRVEDDLLFYEEILGFFQAKKLYLHHDVSLSSISNDTGYSAKLISSVVNQHAKMNFNDFINHFRIEEAKSLLEHPDSKKYTIASIAFDSGFNSLSSFNSSFKKFVGMTPSNYRKSRIDPK